MSEMGYVIAPPPVVAVPVAGGGLFPVRRVYCIGRNYAAHALEMGGDPSREPPFFFQKNPDDLDPSGSFPYPKHAQTVHHEVELAVALARGGNDIPVEQALSCVLGYAVAIDMTCRDLQDEAKRLGRPWEIAKAFPRSAPIGPIVPASRIGHPSKGAITLAVDGMLKQSGDLAQMIWKVPEIIAVLSRYVTLAGGDVILTGTPSGVGPVVRGQIMEAAIEGVGAIRVAVI